MTSAAALSVSIVIPSWNGRLLLEEMFPSLLLATKEFQDKTGGSWEVIVVDDGSVDDTIPWIETIPEKRVKLITRRRKSGFALACNLGFTACSHDTIILLSNDVAVDQGFILALLPHFQDSRVFGVCFKSMLRDRSSFQSGGKIGEFRWGFWKAFRNYDVSDGHAPEAGTACYSFSIYGGFCALNRQKLQELGGFEPLMSPFYWEDVELSYRAWKRGWVIHYEPKSVVYLDATSDPRESTRGLRLDRMNIRNRFIFLWKNLHDPGMWLAHLGVLPVLCLKAALTLRAAFFLGLWDCVRALPEIVSKRRHERRSVKVCDDAIRRMFHEFRKKSFVVLK